MSPRRPFVYIRRTPEDVKRLRRQYALERACRNGDTAQVCELLRAEHLDAVADFVEHLLRLVPRYKKPISPLEQAQRLITYLTREEEQRVRKANGGRLPPGTRPSLVDAVKDRLGEDGDLQDLVDDPSLISATKIVSDLERGKKKRKA